MRVAPEDIGWEYRFQGYSGIVTGFTGYIGIGREHYLAHLYLYLAAAARRYANGKSKTLFWNTENELNWTYVHVLVAGWRFGNAWLDSDFLDLLLGTMYKAMKTGNSKALTTMNINIHDPDWIVDLTRWQNFLDIIGIGAYPNYLVPSPPLGEITADAVKMAREKSDEKPVMVMETGYPSGPKKRGWTEEIQAEYIKESAELSIKAGADGFFYFRLDDGDFPIAEDEVQAVENYWGLVRLDGTRKPGFEILKKIINKME